MGKITYEQKAVSFIFFAAAFCWITKNLLIKNILPGIDDTIISIFFATLLFIINVKGKKEKILKWEAKLGLNEMCTDYWNFHLKNPGGYK